MAYSFESKFEVGSIDELERRLRRVSAEAAPAIAASNRDHAWRLAELIRQNMPVGGSTFIYHRHPESHADEGPGRRPRKPSGRPGRMKASVRSGGSSDSAWIKGGGAKVPYFRAQEFGGAVNWYNSRGKSHTIPTRRRSPTMVQAGLYDRSGTQRGSAGWFFYPKLREYWPVIEKQLIADAETIIRRELTSRPIAA